jgi:50S ribosomal protein L16 3-hydroxylase
MSLPASLAKPGSSPGWSPRRRTGGTLEHGPLPEIRFRRDGPEPWTLLVQAVDHHVPGRRSAAGTFRFIPNWRVDDVMVSYAVDGGGVGAHFDHYDVFLVQASGKRRWQLGARCDAHAELLPHDDLRLLARLRSRPTNGSSRPGDILYVPPGVAHNGVAVGDDCMTYSIGFRAPSRGELIASWAEHVIDESSMTTIAIADPEWSRRSNPGEISARRCSPAGLWSPSRCSMPHAFRAVVRAITAPSRRTPRSTGARNSPIAPGQCGSPGAGIPCCATPASRFSFIRREAGALSLSVDGRAHDCTGSDAAFAEQLCARTCPDRRSPLGLRTRASH